MHIKGDVVFKMADDGRADINLTMSQVVTQARQVSLRKVTCHYQYYGNIDRQIDGMN